MITIDDTAVIATLVACSYFKDLDRRELRGQPVEAGYLTQA